MIRDAACYQVALRLLIRIRDSEGTQDHSAVLTAAYLACILSQLELSNPAHRLGKQN